MLPISLSVRNTRCFRPVPDSFFGNFQNRGTIRNFKITGKIEYDTCMPERVGVRLRCLPDGVFQDASELGWKGRVLELDGTGLDLLPGALLEIESGAMLYFGEFLRNDGSTATVLVEHSLDRAKLQPIQQIWG